MATGVVSWSQTAATNATADSAVNAAEGMAPSAVNDSMRGMMSSAAKYRDDTAGSLTTGGTSTAFTLTTNQVFASLSAMSGQSLTVKFNAANGASPTLNVDSLGAKALQTLSGTAIPEGLIAANSIWNVTYDNSIPAWIVNGVPAAIGTLTMGTQLILPNGSVSAPSLKFSGANGLYLAGGNNPAITVDGTQRQGWTTTGSAITGTLSVSSTLTASSGFTVSAGSVTLPSASVANAALVVPNHWTKLSAQTISSVSSISFTGLSSAYRSYILDLQNVIPATDGAALYFRVSTDNGSTFQSTSYVSTIIASASDGTSGVVTQTSAIQFTSSASNNSSYGFSGQVKIGDLASASLRKPVVLNGTYRAQGGTASSVNGGGYWDDATAINAIQFIASSGNLSTGSITLYGLVS